MLKIANCDMPSTQKCFWEKLNVVMAEIEMPNVSLKGLMEKIVQVIWNEMRLT